MSNIMQKNKPSLYNPDQHAKPSLNREQRKKELLRITIENQAILRRLQEKQPTYSVTEWDKAFREVEKIRSNVCEHPYEFGDFNARTRYMLTTADVEANEGYTSLPRIGGTAQVTRRRQSYNSLGGLSGHGSSGNLGMRGASAGAARLHPLPVIRQAENLDENRIVLYKRSKQLGQGYYIVEISSNNTHLFIAAYDVESPESLLIELPERKAQDILKEFNGEYEQMASSLQVMNKRLVLLNPVSASLSAVVSNMRGWFRNSFNRDAWEVPLAGNNKIMGTAWKANPSLTSTLRIKILCSAIPKNRSQTFRSNARLTMATKTLQLWQLKTRPISTKKSRTACRTRQDSSQWSCPWTTTKAQITKSEVPC